MDSYNNYPVDSTGMDKYPANLPTEMPGMSDMSTDIPVDFPTAEAGAVAAGLVGGILIFNLIVFGAFYIYFAICLMKIAQKTNTANAWFAWVPILNVILMLQVAKKPIWWIILLFIPLVNIIISVIVWMGISKTLGKEEWLGILMIVPVANIILPGYFAFSKNEKKTIVDKGASA
jgi:hypothetical protein